MTKTTILAPKRPLRFPLQWNWIRNMKPICFKQKELTLKLLWKLLKRSEVHLNKVSLQTVRSTFHTFWLSFTSPSAKADMVSFLEILFHTPLFGKRAIKSGLLNHERAWPDCKSEVPSSLISRVVLLRWGKLSKTRPLPQLKWLNFIRCSRKTYRKTNAKLEKDKQSMYSKNWAGLPLESTLVCGLETSDSSRSLADEETSGGYFLTARWTLTGRRLQLLLSDHPLKPHLSHHVQCKKHTFWCTFVHKNSLFALCSTSFDSDNELGNLF